MFVDIRPASVDQIVAGRGGKTIIIDHDVGNFADQIKEIHPSLFVRFNTQGNYYAVLQDLGPGSRPHVVTTSQVLSQALVQRVQGIVSGRLDTQAQADAIDAQAEAENNRQFEEKIHDASERLAFAVRQDLKKATPGPVYVPPNAYTQTKFFVKK